jgi:branched-chain amino acid transport system substrate-binding protein
MKKLFWVVLVVVLAAGLVLSGCAKPAPTAPTAPTAPPTTAGPSEILWGVETSLTGMYGAVGFSNKWGLEAAVDDINKDGGIYVKDLGRKLPVRLIEVDDESDPSKAGAMTENLIVHDKVNMIVNGLGPPHMRSTVAMQTEKYGIPHVTGVGPYEAWMSLRSSAAQPWNHTWVCSMAIATPPPQGDFRYGKLGYTMTDSWTYAVKSIESQTNKKAAAFATDEPDGRGWYMSVTPVLKSMGWEVYRVDDEFGLVPPETTDYTSVIKEWRDNDCQVLWANAPGVCEGTVWKQARSMGWKPKMYYATRGALLYTDVNSWGGDLPNGVSCEIFWTPAFKDSPGIGGTTPMSLNERWGKATGQAYDTNLGIAYADVQVMADAIQRAGSLDQEKVNDALRTTDMYTIYHRVVFDKDNFSWDPVSFGQWQKTDEPWVWEHPVVVSQHDFLPVSGKLIFPIP